jgi:AcrR family transcriptional regulator
VNSASRPQVIWDRPERASRGPRPAHSRAAIAAAAVRVADAEGVDAVSMRRVAGEIGAGTMSLYNYVPRKEDLYELMVDTVVGEYDLPDRPSGDWRADVLMLARQNRALMHRHPWLPRVLAPVHAFGPNALRFLEFTLAAMDGFDAPYDTKVELFAMVQSAVLSYVGSERGGAERARALPWPPDQEQAARDDYLARQLATGRYPHLAAAFTRAPGPAGHDPDELFDRYVNRILDAFEFGKE